MSSKHRSIGLRRLARSMRLGSIALIAVALVGLVSGAALAEKRSYKYETDPVRLGLKSIDNGEYAEAKAQFDEAIASEWRIPDAHRGLGEIFFLQSLYDEAEHEFRLATEGEKPVAEAFAGLGLIALRREQKDEAEAAFRKALAIDDDLWRAEYGLGLLALGKGDVAGAQALLDSGKKKKGVEEGEHLFEQGQALLLLAKGDTDAAEAHALRAFDLAPSNPDVVVTLGEVYEKKGVRALAIQKFEGIIADPNFAGKKAQLHYRLGVLYEREQRFREAAESFQRAVTADSMLADAYLHVGVIFATAKQWDSALRAFRQFTQIAPGVAEGHRRLSEACVRLRNTGLDSLAYAEAKRAIELEPASDQNKLALARATARLREQADVALELYDAIEPDKIEALDDLLLGNLYLQPTDSRDYDKAREHFSSALAADSSFTEIYSRLGIVDLLQQDWLSAEENFAIAIEKNPNSVQDRVNLGQAKLQLRTSEKYEEAAALFKEAHDLAPQAIDPLVLLAQAQTFMEQYDEAVATYGEALGIDPKNGTALGGRGFILLRNERFVEAEVDLKGATSVKPDVDRYWALLGQAYHFQGKILEARSAYDRALAINPGNGDAREGKNALAGSAGQ
ncbi:MAG: tetratricopeptide repeat protein [bacterium]